MGQELAALGMDRMVALTESHRRRSPIPSHGGAGNSAKKLCFRSQG